MSHRAFRLLPAGVLFGGLALAGLSGCNLLAGALFGDEASSATPLSSRVELSVRPVPALFDAAARAPRALEKLRGATPEHLSELLSPEQRAMLRGDLLSDGLIVPIPLGSLTIRTVEPSRPIATVATVRSLAEVVGAYTEGEGVLILDAEGNFVSSAPGWAAKTGSFGVLPGGIVLKGADGWVMHLLDTRPGSYVDERGSVFWLLEAPKSPADEPPADDDDSDDSSLAGGTR